MSGDGNGSAGAGARTIRERLRDASRRCFVGRAGEIELVRSALATGAPPFSVLYIHGPGGVGKTALLGALAESADAAGVRPVRIDMHTVEPTPAAFLRQFAAALGRGERPEHGERAPTIGALAGGDRVVVLIDTLEVAAPLEDWLREEFVPNLAADSVVVTASRTPPSPRWLADPGWRDLLREVSLRNLSPADTRRYLALQGVDHTLHDRLLELTHGHPLALSLVVDVLNQRTDRWREVGDLVDAPDVVRMLMARFVDEIPDARHREALAVCAHARYTSEDLLRAAMGGDDAGPLLEWLRSLSFVEEGRHGLFPHDLARDVFDTDLRWRDRIAYQDLHRRVRAHTVRRMATRGLDQQGAALDLIYLHRLNPVMRPRFDWAHLGDTSVDRDLDGDDRDAVVAMTRRHQGPAQAEHVRHWLEHQPDAFVAFRLADRSVAGFVTLLRLHDAAPAAIAADPGTRAMWEHVIRHDPPRQGEATTAVRFLVDREADQAAPSRSWTALGIAHMLHVAGTVGLAWDLIGACRSPDVAPFFAHIDYHRVPEAEFTIGGSRHVVFAHDWRRVGWDAWLDEMGRRELDDGTGVASPPAPGPPAPALVLSHPEFADAVRAGLRDRQRPDNLARNPLVRSRLLRGRAGEDGEPDAAAAAGALAALLDEAVATLARDPRDAKAHRAVDRTYLRPAATQEQAAEVLGLPFSTYRRHLSRGVDRIVEQLWRQELHGP